MASVAAARQSFLEALANDLNTAEARAAIFEMVREGNIALDAGQLLADDRDAMLHLLDDFDSVFAVIADHDAEPTRAAVEWARAQGWIGQVDKKLLDNTFTDAEIDARIEERNLARRQRNFRRADQIRDELAALGIVLEDSRDGVRWKRR